MNAASNRLPHAGEHGGDPEANGFTSSSSSLSSLSGSDEPADLKGKMKGSVPKIVDRLGFGWAQILILLFGPAGLFFFEGIETGLNSSLTLTLSNDFSLGPNLRAFLMSTFALGAVVGTSLGAAGDVLGRRVLVLLCYAGLGLSGMAASIAPNIMFLLLTRFLMGIFMFLGQAPSRVLMNEFSPKVWQVTLGTITQASFFLGAVIIMGMICKIDPTLERLPWRQMMFAASVPALIFTFFAYYICRESPFFLAQQGRAACALESLQWIRSNNSEDASSITFKCTVATDGEDADSSIATKLGRVWSSKYLATTATLTFVATSHGLGVVTLGFVKPQILGEASTLPPAYQMMIVMSAGGLLSMAAGKITNYLQVRGALVTALLLMMISNGAFPVLGAMPLPRSALCQVVFQINEILAPLALQLNVLAFYQIGTECYPTSLRSTALSVIFGTQKITLIFAPILFENVRAAAGGRWSIWFYLVAGAYALSTMVMVAWLTITTAAGMSECEPIMSKRSSRLKSRQAALTRPSTDAGYGAAAVDSLG